MGAVETVKEVAVLIGELHDVELKRRILKLEEEVSDLSRDKRRAEEKVEELERALKFKAHLTFKEPFYFLEGDTTPYCPACWEDKRKGVHVHYITTENAVQHWNCPNCKTNFTGRGMPTHY